MLFFVPLLSNLALCLLHAQNGSLHEKNRKRGFWDWEKRDGLSSLWGGGELQTSGFNITATMNKEHGSAEGSTSGTESWIQLCCFFIITTQLESQDPCLDWVEFLLHPAGIPMPWSRRKHTRAKQKHTSAILGWKLNSTTDPCSKTLEC